jgi:hypothetical protein
MAVRRRFQMAAALAVAALGGGPVAAAGDEKGAADEAARPPVRLDVLVTERGPGRPWRLRIRNVSEEPVRVVADPRLLRFEVKIPEPPPETPKKGQKPKKPKKPPEPVTCALPSNMLPPKAVDEAIEILEPGQDAVRRFDPRFFCFSPGRQDVLVPGAEVTPTFGWPPATRTVWKKGKKIQEPLPVTAPWLAEPVLEKSQFGPLKEAPVAPLTLGPDYEAWTKGDDDDASKEPLSLHIARGVDATNERGVVVTVVMRNRSKERQRVFFRRELITFEVLGPEGLVECQAGPDARFPMPSAFTSLAPGASSTLTSRVVELCDRGTFARPGLYVLGARFEAQTDGSEFGMDAFTGTIRTEEPVTVRVRTGEQPFLVVPLPPKPGEADKKPSQSGSPAPAGAGKPDGARKPGAPEGDRKAPAGTPAREPEKPRDPGPRGGPGGRPLLPVDPAPRPTPSPRDAHG